MNELKDTQLARPMDREAMANDHATLNGLLAMLNNPNVTGAEVPPEEAKQMRKAVPRKPSPEVNASAPAVPAGVPVAAPVSAPAPVKRAAIGSRLFFTGRMMAGKDYCATQAGATIISLAEPLYFLANHFFSAGVTATANKDLPGVREFLQTAGQWGRGHVSAKYPLTPERAMFSAWVRFNAKDLASLFPAVNWSSYGFSPTIWLDAAIVAADVQLSETPGKRVAITNVRFENEFKRLAEAGWTGYHVMCSQATWNNRLATAKFPPTAEALKDDSEKLAGALDADVGRKVKAQPSGNRLRVIWNDEKVKCPSPRLYALDAWLQDLAISELPA